MKSFVRKHRTAIIATTTAVAVVVAGAVTAALLQSRSDEQHGSEDYEEDGYFDLSVPAEPVRTQRQPLVLHTVTGHLV
ncbi:hypothetical protein OG196_14540 [Kitasatospora purpeofusca]|uniref:hypothetical protein n=1 Tax=Kitasatospora purpeofusca TaxID=67352 RepID=UPI002E0D7837|nr:hypothetical protein OG196_14540 [Kitasatospora purpeofusca]